MQMDNPEASVEVAAEPVDPTHLVKVDGQEQEVTLSELRNGYQRQADYTRKTQELASERQRLEQAEAIVSAIETDPTGTLSALSSAYGLSGNQSQSSDDDLDDMDPTEHRIASLEAELATHTRTAKQQALDKEVDALHARYGDFDEDALYAHALSNRIPNLDAAYAHMNFGSLATYAGKLHAEEQIRETKRGAAVQGGSSTQAGVVTSGASEKPTSIREAFALAKQQLGT